MAIKVTLTVKLDEEIGGPPDAMQQVVRRLHEAGKLPVGNFTMVFLAADESGAELIEEELEAMLEDRAYCIVAQVDRKYDKRDIRRRKLEPGPSPMERALSGSETIGDFSRRHGVDRVELSSRGRTVTLTQETRRNAERALREMGMGGPDEEGE